MQTIIVNPENSRVNEKGSLEIGRISFPGRQAKGETFQVKLKKAVVPFVGMGDILIYGDTGASEWTYQECYGILAKEDGRKIHLTGSRDLGIDTGHPPVLGLKYEQKFSAVFYNSMNKTVIEKVDTPYPLITR